MGTCDGVGQIPHAKVALQLHGIKVGNKTGHDDSSFRRTGWESSSRPGAHLSEAAGLTRRSASRRPTPGREARKSPCQQLSHNYQASVAQTARRAKIAGAGLHTLDPLLPFNPADIGLLRQRSLLVDWPIWKWPRAACRGLAQHPGPHVPPALAPRAVRLIVRYRSGSRSEVGDTSGWSRSSSPMPGDRRATPARRSAT